MSREQETISPASPEIEKSILASILLIPEDADEIIESLDKRLFYRTANALVFEAMRAVYEKGSGIDITAISQWLRDKGHDVPASYLAEIMDTPIAVDYKYSITVLREKLAMRSVIEICNAATKRANSKDDPETTLEYLKNEVDKLEIEPDLDSRMKSVADLAGETVERYDAIASGEIEPGIAPGFYKLNQLMSMEPGDIIFLAGRPSMGKTALALNIILKCRHSNDTIPKTAFFSLEQSHQQLMDRFVAIKTGLDLRAIGNAFFDATGWKKVEACMSWLYQQPIFIDDTPGLSVLEIRSRARKLKRQHGLEFIVIDYLQLMRSRSRKDGNRNLEVGADCVALKALAKELKLPVLVVSQLSRALEKRPNPNKVPMLSDLRDSGEIEQVADKVLFIYRPEVYNDTENTIFENQANVHLAKQRQGPTGLAQLRLDLSSVAFHDVDLHHREVA